MIEVAIETADSPGRCPRRPGPAVLLFFGVKVGAKFVGVYPATLVFHLCGLQSIYTTLMMSTGLTFGSITALFGLTHGYIDRGQYSVLVTVVVLSALDPTLIANALVYPHAHVLRWGAEDPPAELERAAETVVESQG